MAQPMEIFVEKLEFVGYHGVYEEERRDGRRFRVDVRVEVDRPDAAHSDELDQTVDYRGLAEVVLAVGEGESYQLIERMGDEILDRLFERFGAVTAADLTIRKFATGVPGAPHSVGIRMRRERPSRS
jgi:7,8-dihydroneopterin aldolase/epimerase/oxygenase